jgi:hypothetical protein
VESLFDKSGLMVKEPAPKLSRKFWNELFESPTRNPNHRGGVGSPKSPKAVRKSVKRAANAKYEMALEKIARNRRQAERRLKFAA